MLQLAHEMRQILATARGGSHTTRARLNAECHQIAQALDDAGWTKFVRQKGSARSLKSRHAAAIVQLAQKDGLAPGTIKNRLTTLRPSCQAQRPPRGYSQVERLLWGRPACPGDEPEPRCRYDG